MISFENVSYTPPNASAPVLRDFSLEIRAGETLVLLGESGCGKTTTLRLINALLLPSRGNVRVNGADTRATDAISLRRGIGYVLQEGGLLPHFSVARNIALTAQLAGWNEGTIAPRVREMLELVGLNADEFGPRLPAQLSGGQRQRVGVARALCAGAKILLMDEPFGALDPLTRSTLGREFKTLAARLETTVVFVTHDIREALFLGTRIALMKSGQIELLATPQEFENSSHVYARAYLETLNA